ncbi:hypothetical protein K431DRAFT_256917 [Polychaeton citri CBS 116435]|uniref:DNA mismatch repair protein S5 domain-containing protein n=1 Tax=Polychaeton citri CBS 116435 TaxID=1314669 RepID=A0A9P4PZQ5_9PEZI|nr:hypothetical protein K431DRAFT_256917 [Polychaeton citri CBS 116435]
MGIHHLSPSIAHAIGAAQVLTDPSAVVKELVDNALDAQATNISVRIHSNTLDLIEVQDNGHGIPPGEDRDLVARKHCTSKISNEQDLKAVGGASLGFRGEALASAAELSGSLAITTRVKSEAVATTLKVGAHGTVVGSERSSVGVGTTVRIIDFAKPHPVRVKTLLRDADKTLKKIQRTLRAYVFARPQVRVSIRVVKAKNDRLDWTYAPKIDGNIKDFAIGAVGIACATQCRPVILEHAGFVLEAFLPRSDADVSKINHHGHFISVDGRPMSAARGTLRDVAKLHRQRWTSAGAKEPFMSLNITCPKGSYDANIEPAKDDVLFEDATMIVEAAQLLFQKAYSYEQESQNNGISLIEDGETGVQRPASDFSPKQVGQQQSQLLTPTALRDCTSQIGCNIATAESANVHGSEPPRKRQRVFQSNMFAFDDDDDDDDVGSPLISLDERFPGRRSEAEDDELHQIQKDISISNPWTIAKLHAPIRQLRAPQEQHPATHTMHNALFMSTSPIQQSIRNVDSIGIPTPRPSSPPVPNQTPLRRERAPTECLELVPNPTNHYVLPFPQNQARNLECTEKPCNPSHNQCLPSPFAPSLPTSGTRLSDIPVGARRSKRTSGQSSGGCQLNKPFVPPTRMRSHGSHPQPASEWDSSSSKSPKRRQQRQRHQQLDTRHVHQGHNEPYTSTPTALTRNRDMRDFMVPHRSADTDPTVDGGSRMNTTGGMDRDENVSPSIGILGGLGFVPASEITALQAHMASKDRRTNPQPQIPSKRPTLRQINSNATIQCHGEHRTGMRQTQSEVLKRPVSSKTSLESIPTGKATYNLAVGLSTSLATISSCFKNLDKPISLARLSKTVLESYKPFATNLSPAELNNLSKTLQEALTNRVSDSETLQDLRLVVSTAIDRHREKNP